MHRASLAAPIAVVASILTTGTAGAQRVVSSVDVGGTGMWYADTIRSAGSSLSPALRLDWPRGTLSASGNVSQLGGGAFSVQGALAPSAFTPSAGPFTMEIAGTFGGSSHQDGTRTGQSLAFVRGHVIGATQGGWVGGGGGWTWDGSTWRAIRQGDFGAWLRQSGVTALATVSPVAVQDTIRYTDFQAAVRYPTESLELGITAGARSGFVGTAVGGTSRAWGSASAVVWLRPRLALVASAGTYPVDLTQGYPGGRFVTVALRFASRSSHAVEREESSRSEAPATAPENAANTGVTAFEVHTVAGNQRTLRVRAPSARSVELNGDFTRWQPIRLTRGADGWWTAAQAITPGHYQVNLRVDGGPWIAPPGLLTTADEFGGVLGILTVE